MKNRADIIDFINKWQKDYGNQPMLDWFKKMLNLLENMKDIDLEFMARPGVSYSLRPRLKQQSKRNLFAIVDVIDDEPENRWLSVCFYRDMISDPNELGQVIPGGLAGEDGYCFDMFADDADMGGYLVTRLEEAYEAAKLW